MAKDKQELFNKAVEELEHYGKISAALLQRKLMITYEEGEQLLNKLEETGYGDFEQTDDERLLIKKSSN